MSVPEASGGLMAWTTRRARWLIVAVTVAVLAIPVGVTSFGVADNPPRGNALVAVPLALALLALQLRHSFTAARGERPRGALLTLLALAVTVYLPLRWFGWNWYPTEGFLMGSAAMLLPRWLAAAAITAVVLGTDLAVVVSFAEAPIGALVYYVIYVTVGLFLTALGVYGPPRLIRLLGDLQAARVEVAELAVARERLRVSRDLHDLLGQSLSAISLKGDLALRLLRDDGRVARAEIESLTGIARDALSGVRAVTREEHAVSLRTEIDGAAGLLSAAGVDARTDLDLPELAPPAEEVLAWAVREGITNVLRHSHASTCTVMAGRRDGKVFLEVVNDGARAESGEGSGLAGLAERARAVSGSVSAGHTDGGFRLVVEIPEEVR
jgi:two-component system, NarL family, sensor histidine kinase DesK